MSKANGTPLATADSTCSLVMAESSHGVDESTTPSLRRSTPTVSNRMKRFVLVFVTQKSACSPCPLRSIASFGSPRRMSALRSSMSVHLEFVGTGARATPPAGGAVHRFVPLTVALQRCVLRTSRPGSVGQRSDFTNNLEMHRVRVSAVVSGIAGDGAGRDGLDPKGVGVLGGLCQFRIRDHGFQCSPSRNRGGLRVCALNTPSFRFTWREALLGSGACLRLQTM